MNGENDKMKKDLSKEQLSDVAGGSNMAGGVPIVNGTGLRSIGEYGFGQAIVNPGLAQGIRSNLGSAKGNTRCECGGKTGCPYCGGTGYYDL